MAKNNIWSQPLATKTAKIEALNGEEITYRELTLLEVDTLNLALMSDKGVDANGQPTIDYAKASRIKYEKVALMVMKPKVTVEELYALPNNMRGAIDEILALVGEDGDVVDSEGN